MYFITPLYSVAFNAKVASSTLSRAIVSTFYPEQESLIQNAVYPIGKGPDNTQVHWLCLREEKPSKPIVLVIRDPISRFRSAMAQTGLSDVNVVLDAIEQDKEIKFRKVYRKIRTDVHFKQQFTFAQPSAKVFKLEDLDSAATYIGLTLPLPTINEASEEKPILTPEQEARVIAYYSEDQSLYEAVPAGGIDYTYIPPSPEPIILPVPKSVTATQIRLWLVRNGITMAQITDAIASIVDSQKRSEAEVLWEYAPYIERTNPLVATIAPILNMDNYAIDQAFIEAAKL